MLKPCPFCGRIPVDHDGDITVAWCAGGQQVVICPECFTEGPVADTEDGAIQKWNTRPGEDALNAENEKLKVERDVAKFHPLPGGVT